MCFRPGLCRQGGGGVGRWGLGLGPHWLPPKFLFQPPHPGQCWWQKSCHCHHLLRQISHPVKQTRSHMVGGFSSERMEAAGWRQSPRPGDETPATGILGECGQVISPIPLPQRPPPRPPPPEIASPSHLIQRWWGLSEFLWERALTRGQEGPSTLQHWPQKQTGSWRPQPWQLVDTGQTTRWCQLRGQIAQRSDRAEVTARQGLEYMCDVEWRNGERHTEMCCVSSFLLHHNPMRYILWSHFTDELTETHRD